jgi:predicted enzyme related to lactoylglutathione lyase
VLGNGSLGHSASVAVDEVGGAGGRGGGVNAQPADRFGLVSKRCYGTSRTLESYDCVVTLIWEQTIVDARDPGALGQWWREALGWVVVNDDPEEFEIRPAEDRLPGLLFVRVPEEKTTKNRLHLDFRPDDRDAEVQRLLALGATRADIAQGEQSWIVLADPEGNEFCVLGSRVS